MHLMRTFCARAVPARQGSFPRATHPFVLQQELPVVEQNRVQQGLPRFKVSSASCKSHSYKQACGAVSGVKERDSFTCIMMYRLLKRISGTHKVLQVVCRAIGNVKQK